MELVIIETVTSNNKQYDFKIFLNKIIGITKRSKSVIDAKNNILILFYYTKYNEIIAVL